MFTASDEARFLKRMLAYNISCYGCTRDPIDCKFYDQVFDQSIKCTPEECVEYILMLERCKHKRTAEEFMDYRLGETISFEQGLLRLRQHGEIPQRYFDL